MDQLRHVCFKDLNNYVKRDDYLEDFSTEEKKLLKNNLGINHIIQGTYSNILNYVDNALLDLSSRYLVTDFQSIYRSNCGEVWGLEVNSSSIYGILLTPLTENTFDLHVYVLINGIILPWEVLYDFTSEDIDGEYTKGRILYLKDQYNNSAYYDFKNIKTRVHLSSGDVDLYTFSTVSQDDPSIYIESSNLPNIYNNTLGLYCKDNVFLSNNVNNNHLVDSSKNLILSSCTYLNLFNSSDNTFSADISNASGTLTNSSVTNDVVSNYLSIEFKNVFQNVSEDVSEDVSLAILNKLNGYRLIYEVKELKKLSNYEENYISSSN